MRSGPKYLSDCNPSARSARARHQYRARIRLLVALPASLVLWLAAPSLAVAEPLCSDTWVGPSEASWQTAADWSTGKVPSSTDVACVGSGKAVKVTEGTNQAGVVQGEGSLSITGGSLEVASVLESSTIKTFSMSNGTLTGAGTLTVTGVFEWKNGTMAGPGKTVIGSNLSGNSINGLPLLTERTLVNEGTVLFAGNSTMSMSEGARLENKGTFKANIANASEGLRIASGSKVTPAVVNTGTVEKTEIGGTTIAVPFENHGVAIALGGGGSLIFADGGSSNSTSEWSTVSLNTGTFTLSGSKLAGAISVKEATVNAENVQTENTSMYLTSGATLNITAGTLTIANFESDKSTLTGAGTLDATGSLAWTNGGTMSGSGKTVIASSTTKSQIRGETLLTERTFVNEGVVRVGDMMSMSEGARLENKGIAEANTVHASEGIKVASGSKITPLIVNKGTFEKTEEGETTVSVLFENWGTVSQTSFARLFITNPLFENLKRNMVRRTLHS